MSIKVKPMHGISGVFFVPGDKSVTHRAVMLNSVAEGESKITGALLGGDCLATIDCMRKLGAEITVAGTTVTVRGTKKIKSGQKLFAGNSGTTIRLLTGLLCGRGISAALDGDESLRARPMGRIIEPLSQMGAKITSADGKAPLSLKASGGLSGIEYTLPVASAQVKSALLLAGLSAKTPTVVVSPSYSRDHTEIMLAEMSADIRVSGLRAEVRKSELRSINVSVPGDISGAAYLIALATGLPDSNIVIKNVGVNPTRRAVIDLVNACGGRITLLKQRVRGGERVADLMVESARLTPFSIYGGMVPNLIDELPVLAVLAALAQGKSVIADAGELKVKESDRIASTVKMLRDMGVKAEARDDGMEINGGGVITGGGTIDPQGDHRIAMSAAVAAALSLDGAEISSPEVADISYPGFFEIFR